MWLAKTRISHNSSGWPSNQNKKFKGSKVELEYLRMEWKVMPLQSQARRRDQRLRGRAGRRKGRGEWRPSPWDQLLAVCRLLVSHLAVTKWELPHTHLGLKPRLPSRRKLPWSFFLYLQREAAALPLQETEKWMSQPMQSMKRRSHSPIYTNRLLRELSEEGCACKSASCSQESSQFSQEQTILWLCWQRVSLPLIHI